MKIILPTNEVSRHPGAVQRRRDTQLAGVQVDLPPHHGQRLADPQASGQQERREVEEVLALRNLILSQRAEPPCTFIASQRASATHIRKFGRVRVPPVPGSP